MNRINKTKRKENNPRRVPRNSIDRDPLVYTLRNPTKSLNWNYSSNSKDL